MEKLFLGSFLGSGDMDVVDQCCMRSVRMQAIISFMKRSLEV